MKVLLLFYRRIFGPLFEIDPGLGFCLLQRDGLRFYDLIVLESGLAIGFYEVGSRFVVVTNGILEESCLGLLLIDPHFSNQVQFFLKFLDILGPIPDRG